jgi:hypothetical protein
VKSTKKEWHLDVTLPSQGTESTPAENTAIKLLFDTHFLGFSVVGTPFANSDQIEVEYVIDASPYLDGRTMAHQTNQQYRCSSRAWGTRIWVFQRTRRQLHVA